jgi:VIT1/CCC1 family predicted Fe2+/Mn2+ transporter
MTMTWTSSSTATAYRGRTASDPSLRELTTGELTVRLTEQMSRLAREEAQAAIAEMRAKGRRAGVGAGLFGVAGALALLGGATVLAAVVLLLALVMSAWLSALIVGAAVLLLAMIIALIGRGQLRKVGPPIPEQTAASIAEDAKVIKEGVKR